MTLSGHLTVEGMPAGAGVEIVAFDPQGVPCGVSGVDPANAGAFILHVYGDDPSTPADEGAVPQDALSFVVTLDAATEFPHAQLAFSELPGAGTPPPTYPPRFEDRASYALNVAAGPPPADSDGDGVADGSDAFPFDVAASLDTDGDGFPDAWNPGASQADSTTGLTLDAFPDDIAASLDADGDRFPDRWNPGFTQADSTTGLVLDQYPSNPNAHQPPTTPVLASAALPEAALAGLLTLEFSPYDGNGSAPARVWVEIDDVGEGGGQVLSLELPSPGHPVRIPLARGVLRAGRGYRVQVQHMDHSGEWSAWSEPIALTVPAIDPLDSENGGNGIQDDAEVPAGTPVFDNGVDVTGLPGLVVVAEAESGVGQAVGLAPGAGSLEAVYVSATATLPPEFQPADGLVFPYGMFGFRLGGLLGPGQEVTVTFYFPEPLPSGARWLKLDPVGGLVDLTDRSTAGGDPVVAIVGNRVVLRLIEGRLPDDVDGVANSVLIDPGGPAVPPRVSNRVAAGGGGGGGGCFLGVLGD